MVESDLSEKDNKDTENPPISECSEDDTKTHISNRKARKEQLKIQNTKQSKKASKTETKKGINSQDVQETFKLSKETAALPYCQICGFPVDYCEFGGSWNYCKNTALTEYPQFYARQLKQMEPESTSANVKSDQDPLTLQKRTDTTNNQMTSTQQNTMSTVSKTPEQNLTTKSKSAQSKQVESKKVKIQKNSRAKNKVITTIIGLDHFDIKLDAVAKLLKKKFACGCSVIKGVPGTPTCIEIQGDFEYELDSIILTNFPQVEENSIIHLAPK